MRFNKIVFWIAGIYGVLVLAPSYFLFEQPVMTQGRAITHPEFYYGFVGVALAWQFAFFVIATDPVRFRPLILPGIFEKLSYGVAVFILYLQGRVNAATLGPATIDLILLCFFLLVYRRTRGI